MFELMFVDVDVDVVELLLCFVMVHAAQVSRWNEEGCRAL